MEDALVKSNYHKAIQAVEKNSFLHRKRNQLLYHLELGRLYNLNQQYDSSNYHFNLADDLMEQQNKIADLAVSTTVNPAMTPYRAEPHERIMIHYFKALNYVHLGLTEDALVEVRRLNLKQQELSNQKKGKFNKYSQDPFGLMFMGMIYESAGDVNNAFIAYRNAYEFYDTSRIFKNQMPKHLPHQLNLMADLSGINYQVKEQNNSYQPQGDGGELVLFFESGLAPIKKEKNIFFTLNKDNGSGVYYFMDSNHLIQIPINYNFEANNPNFKPSDLGFLRLAISYYESRGYLNSMAQLKVNDQTYQLELGEDVGALAFEIEKENYWKDLGERLLRLALKKIAEIKLSEQNEYAGLALGITNVAIEKSDTRNWQSLPDKIYMSRVPLNKGVNKIEIQLDNGKKLTYLIEGKGQMEFKNISSIYSMPN